MKRTIDLSDGWRLGWHYHTGRNAEPPGDLAEICRHQATVPGSAHMDLMRDGILPDLYVGDNLDHALWMEDMDWWYVNEFSLPACKSGERLNLVFHGIDTYGTVWLNGNKLGQTENMFIRHCFDVTDLIKLDETNQLIVRLAAPRYSIPFDPDFQPLMWAGERNFARKAQMSFGWDIAPRLMTVGLWRPVEIEIVESAKIENVWIRPQFQGDEVMVTCRCRVFSTVKQTLRCSVRWGNQEEYVDFSADAGLNLVEHSLALTSPEWWWPVGYGDAVLTNVEVSVSSEGDIADRWEESVGLADIQLVQEKQPSGSTSFKFNCNGRDMLITGLNWTPYDAMFAQIDDTRVSELLESLRDMGCNMLRIWGGGIYENQHFFRECNRLGIMVWQDFMMSCAYYPQTDAFCETIRHEAQQVVQDYRNHVCLALWCGDNEVDMFYGPEMAASNKLTRQVLPDLLAELDPDTPYIPSSPYTPSGGPTRLTDQGDTHCWNHGKGIKDDVFWQLRCRFLSEFGFLSLPSLALIERYIPEHERWPLNGRGWRYHAADTIRAKIFRGPDKILDAMDAMGMPLPQCLAEAVDASQSLQAEALCQWIDHYCEDPEFAGFLVWNVKDCWPQQSDAVFDYEASPKQAVARLAATFAAVQEQFQQNH